MTLKFKIFIFLFVLYAIMPFIAGYFAIGRLMGPKIYFAKYHVFLYRMGYSVSHEDTARYDLRFERPLFYGFSEKKTIYYYEWEKNQKKE